MLYNVLYGLVVEYNLSCCSWNKSQSGYHSGLRSGRSHTTHHHYYHHTCRPQKSEGEDK